MKYLRESVATALLIQLNKVPEEMFLVGELARKDTLSIEENDDPESKIEKAKAFSQRNIDRMNLLPRFARRVITISKIIRKIGL